MQNPDRFTGIEFIGSAPREPRVNLICLLEQMRAQPIAVNGTTYLVSPTGSLDNIPQSDADKLIENRDCWRLCPSHEDTMPLKGDGEPADLTLPNEPTYRPEDVPPVGYKEELPALEPDFDDVRTGKVQFSLDGKALSYPNSGDGERIIPTAKSSGALGFAPITQSQYDAETPRKRGRPKKGTL